MTATEPDHYLENNPATEAVGQLALDFPNSSTTPPRLNSLPQGALGACATANLYCASSILDAEVRRLLGEAITAQIAGSEAQEISANPKPDLKTCRVLTDFGTGDWRDDAIT